MSHSGKSGKYRMLEPDKIVETIDRLSQRIADRFSPNSGLYNVCRQLHDTAQQAKKRAAWVARPLPLLRLTTAVGVLAVIAMFTAPLFFLDYEQKTKLTEFVPLLEAAANLVVLVGAAVFFLITTETRMKRKRALGAIHEVRAIAHIIDMHQLTKDPERYRATYVRTSQSPSMDLKPFELGRYLQYCSEMLALTGKVAALYVQRFDDPVAIESASDVEDLCTGLANKIWQKISMLEPPLPKSAQS
jgi:hypothetical protein